MVRVEVGDAPERHVEVDEVAAESAMGLD